MPLGGYRGDPKKNTRKPNY